MDKEPTTPKTPQELEAAWMASDHDKPLGSETDLIPRPFLAGEEPTATATGENGVSVRVFMGSQDGSASCAAGSASDPQPLVITSRDPASGNLVFTIIRKHPSGEDAQATANRLRDAAVEIVDKLNENARARDAERRLHPDLPVCYWCERPIHPGTEYTPDGGDRDDNPLPDEPFHAECALDYAPGYAEISELTKRRLAEWEARQPRRGSDE